MSKIVSKFRKNWVIKIFEKNEGFQICQELENLTSHMPKQKFEYDL